MLQPEHASMFGRPQILTLRERVSVMWELCFDSEAMHIGPRCSLCCSCHCALVGPNKHQQKLSYRCSALAGAHGCQPASSTMPAALAKGENI